MFGYHLVIFFFYGWGFEYDAPRWVPVLLGVFTFFYFHLDNMDGKQARKTGNSSPLGMLFDHGADSIIDVLIGINTACIAQVGNVMMSFWVVVGFTGPFYFATLESYHIGGIFLPVINAISDGSILFYFVCWLSFYTGKS